MNLLFCFNQNCLGQFICCLKSILRHGGYDHYDVYILHSFLDNELENALRRDFEASVSTTGIDCHIASIIQAMHTRIPSGCKKFCVFPLDTNLAERGFSWGGIWFRSGRRASCKAEKSQRCADQEYFAILHLSITIWLSAKIEKRHVLRQ